jgi:hypothetical protein
LDFEGDEDDEYDNDVPVGPIDLFSSSAQTVCVSTLFGRISRVAGQKRKMEEQSVAAQGRCVTESHLV